MGVKKDLRTLLLADGPVAALVADQIYLAAAGEGAAKPHLVITSQEGERIRHSGVSTDWRRAIVEIASVAALQSVAEILAGAVFDCLKDYAGDGAAGGGITDIELVSEKDAPNLDGSQNIFAVVQVYAVTGNL